MKMWLSRCEPKKRKICASRRPRSLSSPDTDGEPDCKAVWRLRKHSEHLAAYHDQFTHCAVHDVMYLLCASVQIQLNLYIVLMYISTHSQCVQGNPVQWYCELCWSKAIVIVTEKFQFHSAMVIYAISTKAMIQTENGWPSSTKYCDHQCSSRELFCQSAPVTASVESLGPDFHGQRLCPIIIALRRWWW